VKLSALSESPGPMV